MTDDDDERRTEVRSSERAPVSLKAEPERVVTGECIDIDIDIDMV